MAIKLPLECSFASLCAFIATLRDGLEIVAEGATDNETAIDGLCTAIIAGEVKAQLSTQDDTELATQDGVEILAIIIFS